VELRGEDLSFYSNGIKSVGKKMSISGITVTSIEAFLTVGPILPTAWRQKPADIDME